VRVIEPQARFFSLDGLRFHAIDWGGPERASWIVLLHGLASQAHIWDLVAPRLAQRWRVIALDQRGHGLSDKPDTGYDFASVTRDLDRFLQAAHSERPVLIGHSWGGSVALDFAAQQPERVIGLVLVDGGFLEIGSRLDWPAAEKALEPPDLAGTPLAEIQANLRGWLGPAWSEATASIALNNFEVLPDQTIRPRLRKANHMKIVRAIWEYRPSPLYEKVRCPALLIPAVPPGPHDERPHKSIANKREAVALAERLLPHSRTLWMEDTLHDIPLHRPEELARAIEAFVEAEIEKSDRR
jgi:pimeloyl-ACP methyl ester carboxylesterase